MSFPYPQSDPPLVRPLSEEVTRARELLESLSQVPDLDPLVRGSVQIAAIRLADAPQPPPPVRPQLPSRTIGTDLQQVLDLLKDQVRTAGTAEEAVRLGLVARAVHEALTVWGTPPTQPDR